MEKKEKKELPFTQSESTDPLHGKVAELRLPSDNIVTIREQTGSDDDIISSYNEQGEMSTPLNKFVAAIVINHSFSFAKNSNQLTLKEILDIPLRDKYYILMASRIFSISPVIKFSWDWKDGRPPIHYEEDLIPYLPDYSLPLPEPGDEGYFKYRVEPYIFKQPYRELTLESGKLIRYKWLDGHGENYIINLSDEQRTINTPLKARFMELKLEDGSWVPVKDFKNFKPKEMAQIRNDIETYDKPFDGLTDIRNPHTRDVISIPLLSIPDFFFPRQI